MPQELLRLPTVLARVGWGRSALYKRVKEGTFPSPIELGPRARAWIGSEVARTRPAVRLAVPALGRLASLRCAWRSIHRLGN
jgi:predicted DNA-binding transcriptional regulator AlpA